jgi:hypothetical protein
VAVHAINTTFYGIFGMAYSNQRGYRLFAACAALVFGASMGAAYAQRKPLALEDLKALEQSQSWQELAQSLGDLPPAQRTAQWEAIATNTALQLMGKAAKSKQPGETFNVAENVLEQFPQLTKSKAFMDKRAEVGMVAMSDCYDSNRWWPGGCNTELARFVERDESNSQLQFAAGKLMRLNNRHSLAAPFFEKSLSLSATPQRCADPDVGRAVISAMGLPYNSDFKAQITAGQTIAEKYCSTQMKPLLLQQAEPATGYYVTNACPVMKKIAPDEDVIKKNCP